MRQFADLYTQLDQTNKTNRKLAVLKDYLAQAPDGDKLWAVALFSHRRPRRQVTATQLRRWAAEAGDVPDWLFEESYHIVGDLAETVALLLPPPVRTGDRSLSDWMQWLAALAPADEDTRRQRIQAAWGELDPAERLVFTKLITGSFRIGISQNLMLRALAEQTGEDRAVLAHRLMGQWQPDQTTFADLLLAPPDAAADASRPYPFFLAHPLEAVEALGTPADWLAEWKWDGIRAQVIRRDGGFFVWSRGEELITDRFPELATLAERLPPGTVVDGELLPFRDGQPLPFGVLQTRLGRKTVSARLLREAPVALYAYDLLEWAGQDVRAQPLSARRALLTQLIADCPDPVWQLSPPVAFADWDALARQRQTARDHGAEGLMLKRLASPYGVGRPRGDWWKWKVAPLTIDGVLIYAQKGSGRRAGLFTDYTFGVWDGDQLVPFAKAYSGLTDAELRRVDQFVKRHTRDRFGPVRTVQPELVFEIGFEGIQASKRHKSGVALRFPRMLRWRHDKPAAEADTLATLQELLRVYGVG